MPHTYPPAVRPPIRYGAAVRSQNGSALAVAAVKLREYFRKQELLPEKNKSECSSNLARSIERQITARTRNRLGCLAAARRPSADAFCNDRFGGMPQKNFLQYF